MKVYTRAEWGAEAAKGRTGYTPVADPTIHYNGPAVKVPITVSDEMKVMRALQDFHQDDRGWNDIAYNYVVFPSGRIYEARGKYRPAANGTTYGNQVSTAVMAYIGQGQIITPQQTESIQWMVVSFLNKKNARPHSSWKATACPGDKLRALIEQGAFTPDAQPHPVVAADQAVKMYELGDYLPVGIGSGASEVKAVQRHVWVRPDGVYGPLTQSAVEGWQTGKGIETTGKWDAPTHESRDFDSPFTPTKSTWLPVSVLYQGQNASSATRKALTKRVQAFFGYGETGVYSSVLEATVRGFQASVGLTVDGKVGRMTWGTIFAGRKA